MNDYYTYVPELGEAQYEAEQTMLAGNAADEVDVIMQEEYENSLDADYYAEQAHLSAKYDASVSDFDNGDDCDNRDAAFDYLNDWCYGDNSTAEENAAMARAEARHEPARQAHLMGAW